MSGLYLPRIPWDVVDTLKPYFERLLNIIRKEPKVPKTEDLDILQILSPLMRQILLYKRERWEFGFYWIIGEHGYPEYLWDKRSAARQTFGNLVSEVDKVLCPMHVRTTLSYACSYHSLDREYIVIYDF